MIKKKYILGRKERKEKDSTEIEIPRKSLN